jgi:hypothetical protein
MKTRHSILLLAICATATACTQEPPPPLEQQLSGKNAEERRNILASACEQESKWPRGTHTATISRMHTHTTAYVDPLSIDMQTLCDKLDAFLDPDAEERPDAGAMAEKCADLARNKQRSHRDGNEKHAAQTLRICEEALGTRISPTK